MTSGKNRNLSLPVIVLLVMFSSCSRNIVFTDSADMPDKKWELMNILSFRVPVSDTLHGNDIAFTIRTGSSYPFRNIFLFVTTTAPDGKSVTDTLEYYLADDKGRWYGRGFGDIHELNLPYKSNVYFPQMGSYRFNIQHGMRVEDLAGVYDFGIRVEKSEK